MTNNPGDQCRKIQIEKNKRESEGGPRTGGGEREREMEKGETQERK